MTSHPVTKYIPQPAWSLVEDKVSQFAKDTLANVVDFVETECLPAEAVYHQQVYSDPDLRWKHYPNITEDLKKKAKARGLWNLFLSKAHYPDVGVPLTNLEYGLMAEIMGRCRTAQEAMNCSAPDTGNMEVFARYGSPAQKEKWLAPLLRGEIRSAFAMTEKGVASSDAKNIQTRFEQVGNEIVINGHKWWISGAGDPRCKVHLVMGKHDPNAPAYLQQSVVIVPADAPGITLVRPMRVFGNDDAPEGHMEIIYKDVRVPLDNLVYGWGKGFEIIQGRLGPGRIHHCMRSIGAATRAHELMVARVTDERRKTFGKVLADHGLIIHRLALNRNEIDQARLLVLQAANEIDKHKSKGALKAIAMAKSVVPIMACNVIDRAIQSFGAEGISQDQVLASMYTGLRTLRFADGPDEVHLQQIGRSELQKAKEIRADLETLKERENALLKAKGITRSHL